VLGHAELGPRLQQQAVSHMAGTVLTNYTISFDQAARALRGDAEADSDDSLLNLYSKAAETAFWSMLMSLLVLVVMVVVFIRMERHLRVISERAVR
jgi:disulfide bond formation protein DsbB